MLGTGNQKISSYEGRYKKSKVKRVVLSRALLDHVGERSSWQLYVTTIYGLYMLAYLNHYYTINAVSSSELVVVTCNYLKEREYSSVLGLAVTEININ